MRLCNRENEGLYNNESNADIGWWRSVNFPASNFYLHPIYSAWCLGDEREHTHRRCMPGKVSSICIASITCPKCRSCSMTTYPLVNGKNIEQASSAWVFNSSSVNGMPTSCSLSTPTSRPLLPPCGKLVFFWMILPVSTILQFQTDLSLLPPLMHHHLKALRLHYVLRKLQQPSERLRNQIHDVAFLSRRTHKHHFLFC